MSLGQQAIWTVCQVEPDTIIYNLPIALRIHSEIDPESLRAALRVLLSRHEQLRVGFRLNETMQPVQILLTETEPSFEQVFCDQELEEQQQISMAISQPFDLKNGPLLRTLLLSNAKNDHILLFCAHHIVADFRSMTIMLDELKKIYAAQISGQQGSLPLLTTHYGDYVNWQKTYLNSEEAEQAWRYWQQQLAGEIPKLKLPTEQSRSRTPSHRAGTETLVLDLQTTQKLKALADQNGATLYMVLLSLFKVLLYRYSGQRDIIIGSPVAGRPKSEFAHLVGYFVNPVALRTHPSGNKAFLDYLAEARQIMLGALEYQNYPFSLLVEKLQPERAEGVWPFYQVMFVLQGTAISVPEAAALALGMPGMAMEWAGMEIESVTLKDSIAPFDLTLMMAETNKGLLASFQYRSEFFERETVLRMLGHFQCLLQGVLHNPLMRLAELPLLTVPETKQLASWNATQLEYPRNLCIHQLFEAQAQRAPDATAVVYESQNLSYRELNHRANRLAHYLLGLGIRPDDRVAICVERSFDMVVGLLGILKAGGAYVPLDPSYPAERLTFMLRDSTPVALLTQVAVEGSLAGLGTSVPVVLLDAETESGFSYYPDHNPDPKALGLESRHLAYVIYTSGSTGQPKGVMNAHSSLCNLARAQIQLFGVNPDSRILQFASFSFDASVSELMMALCSGARLCLANKASLLPGMPLLSTLRYHQITHVTLPSSVLAACTNDSALASMTLIVAGDICLSALAQDWSKRHRFFNAYGPTETTVCATTYCCHPEYDGVLPIGRPIANTQIYILDAHLQPVPLGVRGEIYIGGAGVARGYLNRPELTAERFLPNPFIQTEGNRDTGIHQAGNPDTNTRLYKTGDLGRWLSDRNIEFLGRNDFQVKIRGFRIELGEIEAQLANCPGVREAVVIAREVTPGDKLLVAYLLAQDNVELSAAELRSQLAAVLADYQLPSAFVTLDAFPLTTNGKLDRKALPTPEYQGSQDQEFVAPRDEAEEAVARIWCEVLGIKQLSIHDNFFDLGGHSLSGVQVMGRIKESFGIAAPVKILFESPTVAKFVDKLAEVDAE